MEVIKLKTSRLSMASETVTVLDLSAIRGEVQNMSQLHGKRVLFEWDLLSSVSLPHGLH